MTEKPSHEELQQCGRELENGKVEQSPQYGALKNLFNLSLDMLCVANLDGYFQVVNSAFETTPGALQASVAQDTFYRVRSS